MAAWDVRDTEINRRELRTSLNSDCHGYGIVGKADRGRSVLL